MTETIRICPERDRPCPHGLGCPFALDRYRCLPEYNVKREIGTDPEANT